jgi:hypothetical protein
LTDDDRLPSRAPACRPPSPLPSPSPPPSPPLTSSSHVPSLDREQAEQRRSRACAQIVEHVAPSSRCLGSPCLLPPSPLMFKHSDSRQLHARRLTCRLNHHHLLEIIPVLFQRFSYLDSVIAATTLAVTPSRDLDLNCGFGGEARRCCYVGCDGDDERPSSVTAAPPEHT